jgi:hypothetical protein
MIMTKSIIGEADRLGIVADETSMDVNVPLAVMKENKNRSTHQSIKKCKK